MTKTKWHFSQKTMTKSKFAVKIIIEGQLCTTFCFWHPRCMEKKESQTIYFQTAVQIFVFATAFMKQHQIQENRNKVLDISSVIYCCLLSICECHQAVDVCNSRGFGHVIKTTSFFQCDDFHRKSEQSTYPVSFPAWIWSKTRQALQEPSNWFITCSTSQVVLEHLYEVLGVNLFLLIFVLSLIHFIHQVLSFIFDVIRHFWDTHEL